MFGGQLEKILLNESASVENVTNAMDNHSMVIINYHSDGKDNNTGSRVIVPFAYGLTSAGNPVLRAFQPYGDTTTVAPGWKLFRLDRISYWEETSRRFNEIPDPKYGDVNTSGDDTMAVVIKDYESTRNMDSAVATKLGPKTKEKIYAQTYGDRLVQLGSRNVKNQNTSIYVDTDNNKKVANGFNLYTDNTQGDRKGPRIPDQSYKPSNVIGSVEDGDIEYDELRDAREQVYGGGDRTDMLNNDSLWSDYSHEYTDDEIAKADFDKAVMNRDVWRNKDLSVSRRKFERSNAWKNSADNRFLNRRDSGNRVLYNMENDINDGDD